MAGKLKPLDVERETRPGKYPDGDGLYLVVASATSKNWNYRHWKDGKQRWPGPHPIVVYFHGGGWLLGSEQSDDQFCRDLCRRANMIFISVGYRLAPEHRFPNAAEDGCAATCWIAQHAVELGGCPGPALVAGWSAGGNIAAVTCQLARDRGGPKIAGQLLVCPVTDCSFDRPSYDENANGYFLTRST